MLRLEIDQCIALLAFFAHVDCEMFRDEHGTLHRRNFTGWRDENWGTWYDICLHAGHIGHTERCRIL